MKRREYTTVAPVVKYGKDSILQKRADFEVTVFMLTANLPFKTADNEGLKRFMEFMHSKFNVPTSEEVAKVGPKIYEDLAHGLEKLLAKELPHVTQVCFTAETWVRGQNQIGPNSGYLALNIHYISDNFEYRKLMVASRIAGDPAKIAIDKEGTTNLLSAMIKQIPGLKHQTKKNMVGGSSTANLIIDDIKPAVTKIISIEHTLNSVLLSAWSAINSLTKKIFDFSIATATCLSKNAWRGYLENACDELLVEFVPLEPPSEDCAESLFRSVEALVKLREPLRSLSLEEDCPEEFLAQFPSEETFNDLEELLPALKVIHAGIAKLRNDRKPTIHLVIQELMEMGRVRGKPRFRNAEVTTRNFLAAFEEMLSTLIPNFGRDDPVYSQANFLHPSFKGYHLKSDRAYERTLEDIRDLFDKKHQKRIEDEEYEEEELEELEVDDDGWTQPMPRGKKFLRSISDEIQIYVQLVKPPTGSDIDILSFWKGQEELIPQLASLARAILAIPPSSDSADRCFSSARNCRVIQNCERPQETIFCNKNFSSLTPFIPKWSHLSSEYMRDRKKTRNKHDVEEDSEDDAEEDPGDDTEDEDDPQEDQSSEGD